MAIAFASASSQYLLNNAPPITTTPFSLGFWLRMPTGGSFPYPWCLADAAGNADYWAIYLNGSNQLVFECAGGPAAEAITTTAITSNGWTYVVLRAISATNRRITVLHANGVVDNAQNTTSLTPAGLDRMALGAFVGLTLGNYLDGSIAEFWMTNVDIQADGAALFDSTLRQLARNGPFSVMNLMGSYFHYRSFRRGLASDQDGLGDVFTKGAAPLTWTNTNAATLGPHVPLPQSYARPDLAMTRALLV